MNTGTRSGNADGVRLKVLLSLTETKGVDSEYSLMTFVYDQVAERYPEAEDFDTDLDAVFVASKEEAQWLQTEIGRVQAETRRVAQEA